VDDQEYLAAFTDPIAANLETLVGELKSPKSPLKHLFGTGKDRQVSPKRAVRFRDIGLAGVRMQKKLQGCKNFCG
jgi:hypothetical protein